MGIFLQVKRGEKINKSIYKEPWQNASNDELGQMIFSFVYLHPGIARNSKNKMLSHDPYYRKIYKNNYSSDLFEFIFEAIAVPTYIKYKEQNPAYAYFNFTKNDSSFYRHVLPYMALKFRMDSKFGFDVLERFLAPKTEVNSARLLSIEEQEEFDKQNLFDALVSFRWKKFHDANKTIPAYYILKDNQIEIICAALPRTTQQLSSECKLSSTQVSNYGEEILHIVSSYLPKIS